MALALGIDGGGTRTRCLVIDEVARVIGYGVSGASKPDAVDAAIGRSNLHEAVLKATHTCGVDAIDSVFVGMGGVISPTDVQVVHEMLTGLDFRASIPMSIDHDIRIALAGGTAGQPGIALIVGTGSSCYGRSAAGNSWRSGGWGYIIDDGGSSFYLGQQALAAVVRAHDGRGDPTTLTAPILEALGLSDILTLMHRLYYPTLNYSGIAGLARIVVQEAEVDGLARSIVERGCAELALMVKTTAQRLQFIDSVPVVLVGGLVSSSRSYRRVLEAAIQQAVPNAEVIAPMAPPVVGAALLALLQVGFSLSADALARIQADETA